MQKRHRVISVDIGSTHTKGALFELNGEASCPIARAARPTTQEDLALGLGEVLRALTGSDETTDLDIMRAGWPVRVSSSAKGGLSIVAIGLVPELTLELARMAAMSAGGKVVAGFAFALTRQDMRAIEALAPDILMLAGGTDGGHTDCVLRNATALAESALAAPILYAGNRSAADAVAAILKDKDATITENIMPAIHAVNVEPARQAIQRLFLERLVVGKGLARIVEQLGASPHPTPLGVLRLVEIIPEFIAEWRDFCLVDLGGATTDFYSNTDSVSGDERIVLKGILEPRVKRTVEGDLGLRVSAPAALDAAKAFVAQRLSEHRLDETDMKRYMNTIARKPEHIAVTEPDTTLDRILAEACVRLALNRHAGHFRETYTPQGKVYVQTGKDLRAIKRVVGSGGFLSGSTEAAWLADACAQPGGAHEDNAMKLTPQAPVLFLDRPGLFPLLGNLADEYPAEAATMAVAGLEELFVSV